MLVMEVVEMSHEVSTATDPAETPVDATAGTTAEESVGPAASPEQEPAAGPEEEPAVRPAEGRAAARPRPVTLGGRSEDNHVMLRGRVSTAPVARELPSGTVISTFRVSVLRARTAMTAGSSQSVDWIDCAAWTARARRRVESWVVGDEVEVTGALRRRFFRAGVAPSTRLELEVLEARRQG